MRIYLCKKCVLGDHVTTSDKIEDWVGWLRTIKIFWKILRNFVRISMALSLFNTWGEFVRNLGTTNSA